MGLPQNLGRLSAGLTADASLNIGVGVTPSGTYKFEVNGALGGTSATFSGTINSTVGNNGALLSATTATTGYQYIDIITTSGRTQLIQESSVAGTTVTNSTAYASMFGSAVAKDVILFTNGANRLKLDGSTGAALFTNTLSLNSASGTTGTGALIFNYSTQNAGSRTWKVSNDQINYGDFVIQVSTTQTGSTFISPFQIASTGAATFSSSVTSTQLITKSISGNAALFLKDESAVNKWEIGHITNSLYFYNYTRGGNDLILNGSTGAATFNGSLITLGTVGTVPTLKAGGSNTDLQLEAVGTGGNLYFYTNSTLKMLVKADGNVGIGTTSPASKLDILGANEVMNIAGTNSISAYTGYYYNTSTLVGYIGNGSSILSGAASSDFIFRSQGALVYATSGNNERMRITTGGNVLIGTTTASYSNANRGNLTIGGASDALLALQVGGTARSYFYSDASNTYIDNASGTGNVYVSNGTGGVYLAKNGTSWTSNSDSRLKNINSNIDSAVDKLMTLRAVNFSWKTDSTNKENLGLIAQDVEKVFPQIIDKNILPSKPNQEQADKIEYLGVRYQELVPVLVAAIKEQQQQIKELQSQINK